MKSILVSIVAAGVLVGCGESQQSAPAPETPPAEPVAETAKPEPTTPKAPDISIHDAAKAGDIETVKQHLAAGTEMDVKGKDGWTSLHWAASSDHKEIVELLISAGANVNAEDTAGEYRGSTPLDWAPKTTAVLLRKHGGKTMKELEAAGK
jgi:hypothetical protein|tara:strand:+ start:1719 stop:2171 length:453 start_codon:yes stop_codon:yes gene_type:complete